MTIDSDKILHDLLNSLDSLEGIRPEEIPNIALYMDQVTTFMDAQLASSRRFESDKVLTKTMINNYAKNKLLPPPVKKKYSPEHMMLLVFIYYFKNILSITDIQTLLAPITDRYFGTESGFSIKDIYDEIFQMEKEEIASVKEDLLKKADVSKSMFGSSPEEDREFLQLFSFICLLSFDVYLKKQMIEHMVDELASELQGRGYAAEGIHGDMKQVQRDRVMKKFRNGKTDILIATDVAARGIDVDDVEAVFNYDLPQDNEYYVHRIGRTGRAGRTGKAFNFVKGKEVYKLKEIQRYCKTKIKAQPIPSSDDVAAIKADKILDGIGQIIEDGDLRDMIELIEQQVNNSDYTAMDIAAAFLKQAIGGVELSKEDHEFDDALAGDTGAEEGMVRLFINIGKSQRIRPGDILGAVAGEAKIPGKLVGAIDMYDNYTFVEVPQEYGKDVLKAMKNVKIKGKSVNVEPANAR